MGWKVQISPCAVPLRGSERACLLLGLSRGKEAVILSLAPLPATPAGVPYLPWAAARAAQVTRLLPGGAQVLGAFMGGASPRALAECIALASAVSSSTGLALAMRPDGRLVARTPASSHLFDVHPARSPPVRFEGTLQLSADGCSAYVASGKVTAHARLAVLHGVRELAAGAALAIPDGPVVLDDTDVRPAAGALGWVAVPAKGSKVDLKGKKGKKKGRKRPEGEKADPPRVLRGSLLLPRPGGPIAVSGTHGAHIAARGTLALRGLVLPSATLGEILSVLREDAIRSLETRADLSTVSTRAAVRGDGDVLEVSAYAPAIGGSEAAREQVAAVLGWTKSQAARAEVRFFEEVAVDAAADCEAEDEEGTSMDVASSTEAGRPEKLTSDFVPAEKTADKVGVLSTCTGAVLLGLIPVVIAVAIAVFAKLGLKTP